MEKDKELYKQFVEGNYEALNELIEKYRNELVYFIQKYVNDSHAAEDVSQEVFVYLLQHKDVYDYKYSFKTYLFTIGKTRALNYIKARKKVVFIEDNVERLITEVTDVEEEYCNNSDSRLVRKAIKMLKKEYQIVICLIDINELSYEETAIIMNRSISQVKALIHNARKRLKVFLEEERKGEVEHSEANGGLY